VDPKKARKGKEELLVWGWTEKEKEKKTKQSGQEGCSRNTRPKTINHQSIQTTLKSSLRSLLLCSCSVWTNEHLVDWNEFPRFAITKNETKEISSSSHH
jgi:hypothetical protein